MPPIVKDSDVIAATPGTVTANPRATSTLPDASPSRPQPVALEVSVTVNGARTVGGSEKREPFSETTKTVLVFSHGAVIRLASTVAPGQLLFVTNEKTKKEVVCQVVKSKSYRSVSGYVELEFTEPVVGFWGMRFPNDRIGPAPGATVSPLPPPSPAPKVAMPVASVTSEAVKARPVMSKPVEPQVAEVKPAERKPVEVSVKRLEAPVPATPLVARPESPVIPIPVTPPALLSTLPQRFYAKPTAAEPPSIQTQPLAPKNPEPVTGSTESLRLETARLQEQLSSMQFSGAPAPKTPPEQPADPPADKKPVAGVSSKIFELGQTTPPVKQAPVVKNVPPAPLPSRDEESMKIPAWLEPLARNTVAPSSTQELLEREKARRTAEKLEISEPEVGTVAIAEVESVPEVKVPSFGSDLLWDEKKGSEGKVSRGSNKGVLIGAVAAGLILLAGGGAWYLLPQAGSVKNSVTSASVPAAAVTPKVLRPQPAVVPQTTPVNNLAAVPPQTVVSSPAVNSQIATPHDGPTPAPAVTTNIPVTQKYVQPVPVQQQPLVLQQPEPKKPALGEVHLASPKVNRSARSQESGAAEPGLALNGDQITPGSDSLGGELLAGSVKQPTAPAAPLAVGGDVNPAKMISSVPPVYSSLARTQHVSGDVRIDALIDANGRVTSMKVISGPTLLHQPAMDALHQWRYKPATLDGKPVPMHLTVTLQFRLQ
ncbi:MAG TPA: TonB family protein [Candidatus Acidoferrum sp.]|nr:TonB family protein [Candidatus Acidoferrum sp.]